jgi:asparagine synthase (glutamine-hydrolysing)
VSGLRPDFASFVGVSGPDPAPLAATARWAAAIARAASRVALPPARVEGSRVLAACRGHSQGLYRDGDWMILLDGTVDNLHEVATDAGMAQPDSGEAALLARLFARQGEDLLPRLEGSYSLVIANLQSGDVLLARDRFGSRPLFYAPCSEGIAWASEIKSLLPLVGPCELDPEGLRQAIHYRFVIGDTMLRNVSQVLPASVVRLAPGRSPAERRYWRLAFDPALPGAGLDAWADRVDSGLDAFMSRLRNRYSRVGILLSGGVDSSLLALKARHAGFRDCVALTARWPGENPELELAAAIAKRIGIEHQVVDIDEARFERLLPWIVWRLEELPRHYSSFVLACLFEHAAPRCETILHGHSADVMFGPPDATAITSFNRRRRFLQFIPRPLRRLIAARLPYNDNRRIHRLRQYLELDEHGYLKSQFAIEYGRARAPVKDLHFRPRGPSERALEHFYEAADPAVERMQRLDTYTFNQSHFAALDRLSAPLGVPITTPFLAREMIAIARELPSGLKVDGTLAKPVLKRLMARSFPQEWVYRRKQGFPTHTTRWLTGPLARWRHMLADERTRARGLVSLRRKRRADVGPHYETVWGAMCLEIFCRQFLDGDGGPEFPASGSLPP